MSLIVQQRVDASGIFIRAANGRTVTIDASTIKSIYDTNVGKGDTRTVAKDGTVTTVKASIQTALGDNIDASLMAITFDENTGRVTESTIK